MSVEEEEILQWIRNVIETRTMELLRTECSLDGITLSEPAEVDVEDLPDYVKFNIGGDL